MKAHQSLLHAPQVQSFDQKFESSNKALLVSCQKGLPVRVVRSHKVSWTDVSPINSSPVKALPIIFSNQSHQCAHHGPLRTDSCRRLPTAQPTAPRCAFATRSKPKAQASS